MTLEEKINKEYKYWWDALNDLQKENLLNNLLNYCGTEWRPLSDFNIKERELKTLYFYYLIRL